MNKFTSVANWPEGTFYDSYGRPRSTDTHHSLEAAQCVCAALMRGDNGTVALSTQVLVKKRYTALAVTIDTALPFYECPDDCEMVPIGESPWELAVMAYYASPHSDHYCGLPRLTHDSSRIHRGSAFREKRK